VVALISFAIADKANLDDSILAFVADALNVLDFEGLNHSVYLSSARWLLADVAVAVASIREEIRGYSCRHAARGTATIFDVEVSGNVFYKRSSGGNHGWA
jgi:hypothetical protein